MLPSSVTVARPRAHALRVVMAPTLRDRAPRAPPFPDRGHARIGPMARTTIHLMRHGEVHNPEGVLYGRLPGYHLSALGREMAAQVVDVLGRDCDAILDFRLRDAAKNGIGFN